MVSLSVQPFFELRLTAPAAYIGLLLLGVKTLSSGLGSRWRSGSVLRRSSLKNKILDVLEDLGVGWEGDARPAAAAFERPRQRQHQEAEHDQRHEPRSIEAVRDAAGQREQRHKNAPPKPVARQGLFGREREFAKRVQTQQQIEQRVGNPRH